MAVNYQKLYAYLVGQIDEAIEMIDLAVGKEDCGKMDMALVKGKLIGALQNAEEQYLEAEE